MAAAAPHSCARPVHTVPAARGLPLTTVIDFSLFPRRFAAGLIGAFGLAGLRQAVIGLYGVLGLLTAQRTREFGVRRALGAHTRDIGRPVLRRGLAGAADRSTWTQ